MKNFFKRFQRRQTAIYTPEIEVMPPLDARFEQSLKGIQEYMLPDVRNFAAQILAERNIAIGSLDENGVRKLTSDAYGRASDKNWAEILADPHRISSVPQDVWAPKKSQSK